MSAVRGHRFESFVDFVIRALKIQEVEVHGSRIHGLGKMRTVGLFCYSVQVDAVDCVRGFFFLYLLTNQGTIVVCCSCCGGSVVVWVLTHQHLDAQPAMSNE